MNIQGYQKMTLLDFPGKVACTVFTGGCNLRCPFCHNAGLVRSPKEYDNLESEVLSYLSKRRGILDGVCVTGGEPLLQPDLGDFLKQVKEMGLAVKLDTNGSLPALLESLLATGWVDYVAMDVKSSPEGYSAAVGRPTDFAPFRESIRLLKESGIPHEFRTTAVKGIHTPEDFEKISREIGDAAYFIQAFVDSGNLLGEGCTAFDREESLALLEQARTHTPRARLRGQDED
ncbi:MAG: anaerobic ribonucleoside-triphosphate reductase activating protein [Clostridia bacterium]|nr:anaerobic ribonucleoside-triphosphate reductase activating protein [Clostridia bacterium]